MFLTDNMRIEDTGCRSQWVYSRVNTKLCNLTVEHGRRVQMAESSCRSRVCQVIGRHIYSLYRSNRTFTGRSDTFLHGAHFRSQCRLVTNGGRHTSQKSGYFRTGLRKTENIIYKEQDITLLAFFSGITE